MFTPTMEHCLIAEKEIQEIAIMNNQSMRFYLPFCTSIEFMSYKIVLPSLKTREL